MYAVPRPTSIILLLLLLSASVLRAQERHAANALAVRIATAHASGVVFERFSLFSNTSDVKHPAMLQKETILKPSSATISRLHDLRPTGLAISLRDDEGNTFDLELLRSQPVPAHPNTGFIDAGGRHRTVMDLGTHYQGIVTGRSNTVATLSVFPNNDLMLLFADSSGNYVVGKLEDRSGLFIFYNDHDLHGRPPVRCATENNKPAVPPAIPNHAKTTQSKGCNKVTLYWEIGYGLYTYKGSSLTNTSNYMLGLFNQLQALYAADGIAVELKSMYIWTTPEAYSTATTSISAKTCFGEYWAIMGERFDGDMGHMITRTPNNLGGIATLGSYCLKHYTEAFSDIYGSFNSIPVYSWDVEVVAHETGHNLGSPHTQSCTWMTGPSGTCGAIDNCAALENVPFNCTCSATYDNTAPNTAWQGTIMSYCHLASRGINLANGFGPLPAALIRAAIASNTLCLSPALSASLEPSSICAADGSITLNLLGNNFGTPPYIYTWSNGSHTQNLLGLSAPGTYSVTINDSAGCALTLSAEIGLRPHPGDGTAPGISMPVCCTASAIPLLISASTPQNLRSCETVYWLRSAAPLGSVAGTVSYFDTASAVNILQASNPDSIQNGKTGASLEVYPPLSCDAPLSYYYTPIVVTKSSSVDSLSSSVSANTPLAYLGTYVVGATAVLPDQSGLIDSCRYPDTPGVQTITVKVTNYTGRPNRLQIVVTDTGVAGIMAQLTGLPGNGSYVLSLSGNTQRAVHSLQVSAMDYDFSPTTYEPATVTLNLSATRRIVFSQRKASIVESCSMGTAVRVDFAQTGCTRLTVPSAAAQAPARLVPNPTSGIAYLEYTTAGRSTVAVSATDMTGRRILHEQQSVGSGQHRYQLNVGSWACGVYIIRLSGTGPETERMKLVVE